MADCTIPVGAENIIFDNISSFPIKPRSAEITVSHAEGFSKRAINVKQAGAEPYLDVNKTNVSVHSDGFAGSFEKCIEVETKDTVGYTVAVNDNCGWIRVSGKPENEFSDSLPAMTFSSIFKVQVIVDKRLSAASDSIW